jgi:hypothetical protein
MTRPLYLIAAGYLAVCGALLWKSRTAMARPTLPAEAPPPPHPTPPRRFGSGAEWFASVKPNCNALEVETRVRQTPPPGGAEGAGYESACFALAGKIARARSVIDSLGSSQRPAASAIVFEVAHPVADAGDDQSSGPMMELVLEYWPQNYMAVYHAGMSEYALGQPAKAKANLLRFLELYHEQDGWRSNAVEVLRRMGVTPAND